MNNAIPQLQDFLINTAARLPDKVAIVARARRLTYRELHEQSDTLARALVELGIERGDRVIVFDDNSPEVVISFWAILKANAVAVVVNPLTKVDKLAYLLNDCRAKVLLTDGHLINVFADAARRSPHLQGIVVSGAFDEAQLDGLPNVVRWDEALATPGAGAPPRRNIELDLAAIVYTSGSTGEPKGVMFTHRNMLTAATSISTYLENVEDDVILCVLPLSFNYGLDQMVMSVRVGARLVLERSFAFVADVLERIVSERVTGFPGVPTMFATLLQLKSLSSYDFSGIRYVTSNAAALPEKHIPMLREVFPRAKIFSMYGLTECKRCTYLPPADLLRKPHSVGVAIPNTELWIVDENDQRVGPGVVGQLVIRGPTVMKGYWEKPEATAQRLRPGPIPGEQVLYTGDACMLDEEGYLTFIGRMDDIIKSRGEKVPPKEVEQALVNIPGVREAAVIGVPDELLGQAVKAFVVVEAGVTLEAKQLERECQRRLESFMLPKYIEFVAELPRTATGKISKVGLT
jgi:amino acid adenylation domain-containing protein